MPYCAGCGSAVEDSANFCARCGHSLRQPLPESPTATQFGSNICECKRGIGFQDIAGDSFSETLVYKSEATGPQERREFKDSFRGIC